MKKFVLPMMIALFATIMFINTPASAALVYDYNVETMIDRLYSETRKQRINFFNKEYYVHNGARRCEIHYGADNRDSLIRFRLDDNNNVQKILISYIYKGTSDIDYSVMNAVEGMLILTLVFETMGLDVNDYQSLKRANEGIDRIMSSKVVTADQYFHNKSTAWCPTIQRNITFDVEFKNFVCDYYIYSE